MALGLILTLTACMPDSAPLRLPSDGTGRPGPVVPRDRPVQGPATPDMRSEPLPPPLYDDATLMRMDLNAAVAQGTNTALLLFIARNPDAAEANTARAMLRDRRTADPPAAYARGGPDADILREFDAARLSGDPAALAAFRSRHAGHPLAAETRRLGT